MIAGENFKRASRLKKPRKVVLMRKSGFLVATSGKRITMAGTRADESERPPLELVFVILGELRGFVWRRWFADDADEGTR